MAVQTEGVRARIITVERTTNFFFGTLFTIAQVAWVGFVVFMLIKLT